MTSLEKIAEMRRKFRNCMVFIEPKSIEQAHADFDALLSAIADDLPMKDGERDLEWCTRLDGLASTLRGENP